MRQKIILLICIITMFCFLTGCKYKVVDKSPADSIIPVEAGKEPSDNNVQDNGIEPSESSGDTNSSVNNQNNQGSKSEDQIKAGSNNDKDKDTDSNNQGKGNGTVVIKTESQASDQEAEEILDQLDKELDKIIDALDSLNDVDEEDINF